MTRRSPPPWLALLALPLLGAAPGEPAEAGRSLAQWYELGGWIMHLLALCSVLVLAVVLERGVSLRRGGILPRKLAERVREASTGGPEALRQVIEGEGCALARIARVLVAEIQRGNRHPQEAVSLAGAAEVMRVRRNLPLLAALANIATLLGLLGTVLGMIEAFDTIAKVGTSDARVVASGIFQALVTTAAGLSVGIAALTAHTYFRRRSDALILGLEEAATELMEGLLYQGPSADAEEPRALGVTGEGDERAVPA